MLRKLEKKDIPRMLEWMHDPLVNCHFRANFAEMDENKAEAFIEKSFTDENVHFAFTDTDDNYLGTVSLKNISSTDKNAEYAIVTRRKAQGTGAAFNATIDVLRYAFNELNLHRVYLNVREKNLRANAFYRKVGFKYEGKFIDHLSDVYNTMGGEVLQPQLVRYHQIGFLIDVFELKRNFFVLAKVQLTSGNSLLFVAITAAVSKIISNKKITSRYYSLSDTSRIWKML